ncbi:MAG: hypothetical protein RMK51_05650 [Meiothermus sp.]|uniref:hypothetical protein n=1 Tax=Meiothermus sp. TaxID=1955249 RepID=UPI0025F3775A|nr:hypothetical protein [Meiothermus sp.]MCS7069243.1 hypothetical protein [Meiothermus sp.]MDW8425397.1 hypothetical protein [Meiothermus sp.]
MPLLQARMELQLSQALLHGWMSNQLARLDLPVQLLRFPLGRLHGGELRAFELSENRCELALGFATGPALQLAVAALGYLPEPQVWRLRVEHLHFSGFRGGPVLNLMPGRVLEIIAAQANRRLPGLLALGGNMELRLHLEPLLKKAPLGQSLGVLGLEARPEVRVEKLEIGPGWLGLTLNASG